MKHQNYTSYWKIYYFEIIDLYLHFSGWRIIMRFSIFFRRYLFDKMHEIWFIFQYIHFILISFTNGQSIKWNLKKKCQWIFNMKRSSENVFYARNPLANWCWKKLYEYFEILNFDFCKLTFVKIEESLSCLNFCWQVQKDFCPL